MSNFKRNENRKPQEDPFKAQFGHQELDAVLQNQLLKGQLIFIEQDTPTTIYKQLIRSSLGNSYHKGEVSLIFDNNNTQWKKIIPQKASQQVETQKLDQQDQNKIAWRYQSVQNQFKLTNIDTTILRMDLSKSLTTLDENLVRSFIYQDNQPEQLLFQITNAYQQSLKNSTDCSTKKLLLNDLFTTFAQANDEQLIQLLYGLKVLMRSSFMLGIIVIPNQFTRRDLIMPFCDYYLSISQIFGNQQFSEFQAFLTIDKVAQVGTYKQLQLEMDRWGIKATNKTIYIEKLYETAVQEDNSSDDEQSKLRQSCGAKLQDRQHVEF